MFNKKSGFTLIELVVAAAIIIVIITGAGIAGLNYVKPQKQAKATAEKIRSMIVEAHARALTPPSEVFGLTKVRIRLNTTTRQFDFFDCLNAACTSIGSSVQTYNIPSSAIVELPAGPPANGNMTGTAPNFYFSFEASAGNTIGQTKDITDPTKPVTITVRPSNATTPVYTVTVDRITGSVTMQ